jgi:uncharacterized repeat protein (TIGR01451 family)
MRYKWMGPGAVALLGVALVILLSQVAGQAQVPLADLEVDKTVDPGVIAPGTSVIYSVELSNTTAVSLALSSLVDTLPSGFEYVGLAPGNEWPVPPDFDPPELRWTGPITIPMSGTLTLRYWVFVPGSILLSPVPYTNTVEAILDAQSYSDQAGVLVVIGDISVGKTAAPDTVAPGERVTYTVTFSNSGYVAVPLATVTDVLPADVTFLSMTVHSDIPTAPVGVSGTITWTGAYTIGSHAEFLVEYLAAMPVTSDTLHLENQAWGQLGDGTLVGPASAEVTVSPQQPGFVMLPIVTRGWAPAAFDATKTADPTWAYSGDPGALITYTVTFANGGTDAGVLSEIRDALPTGFTFEQMMPGSDVTDPPSGTSGEISWTGPFTVPGESSLTLIYQVQASSEESTYTNSATATASKGRPPENPATATVEIRLPIFLTEEFENPSPYWEEFLNYWRLHPEQWHYAPGGSDDGSTALKHVYWLGAPNPIRGAHDALFMYKDPSAEEWTDYSLEAKAIMNIGAGDGSGRGQFGLWFRGIHRDNPQEGLWATGYYFILQPDSPKKAQLLQLRTDDDCGDDCTHNYYFNNPLTLEELYGPELVAKGLNLELGRWYWLRVEVEGSNIRCYANNILIFDHNDTVGTTFTEGTVGLFTYLAGDARFDHLSVEPLP